jgi:hypothetical protein
MVAKYRLGETVYVLNIYQKIAQGTINEISLRPGSTRYIVGSERYDEKYVFASVEELVDALVDEYDNKK